MTRSRRRVRDLEALIAAKAEQDRELAPTIEQLAQLGGVELPALVAEHIELMRENVALRDRVRQLERWLDLIIPDVIEDEFPDHCEDGE